MDDRFYIIVSGNCAVERHSKSIGILSTGECFGETSYVQGAKRTATIRAVDAVTVLKVSSTLLEQVSASCQLRFNRVFLRIADRATAGSGHAPHLNRSERSGRPTGAPGRHSPIGFTFTNPLQWSCSCSSCAGGSCAGGSRAGAPCEGSLCGGGACVCCGGACVCCCSDGGGSCGAPAGAPPPGCSGRKVWACGCATLVREPAGCVSTAAAAPCGAVGPACGVTGPAPRAPTTPAPLK